MCYIALKIYFEGGKRKHLFFKFLSNCYSVRHRTETQIRNGDGHISKRPACPVRKREAAACIGQNVNRYLFQKRFKRSID